MSSSMCSYISQIETYLQDFVSKLDPVLVDARFAVAAFGGAPDLLLPFTDDTTETKSAIGDVSCGRSSQEAGLEAIRISLANNSGADFGKKCTGAHASQCNLTWRPGAEKVIIVATDEDSDLPTKASYLVPKQSNTTALCPVLYSYPMKCAQPLYEPSFGPKMFWSPGEQYYRTSAAPLTLDAGFANEIGVTAGVILQSAARVTLLIRSDINANRNGPISSFDSTSNYYNIVAGRGGVAASSVHTTIFQYGDPAADTAVGGAFDPAGTLAGLKAAGLNQSLQAQVLAKGGYVRLFKIQDIVDPTKGKSAVDNIFTAIATSVSNCTLEYVPDEFPGKFYVGNLNVKYCQGLDVYDFDVNHCCRALGVYLVSATYYHVSVNDNHSYRYLRHYHNPQRNLVDIDVAKITTVFDI
ncbi:hypothetical protein HK101_010770 [Irineochytrium annulatum]|nr:hypothetical protein HK101_010770 [Irineochytrium annulatum]